jgi:hypothetical protein
MGTPSSKIILSYREGCSGSWLGEILNVCKFGSDFQVNFRQDNNGVPPSIYHFNGHKNDKHPLAKPYNNQPFITCHSEDYEFLKTQWPDSVVYRIIPKTYVLDAVAASWYKLTPEQCLTVSDALEYIKNYYKLHTEIDPHFGTVIDYGNLRLRPWVQEFVENNSINYDTRCNDFVSKYWNLQKKTNLETIPFALSMNEVIDRLELDRDTFYVALSIFVYEKSNNLNESQRCWSVDDLTVQTNLLTLTYIK